MYIYYRISDSGYKKDKPSFINNRNCFKNFITVFNQYKHQITIIADNISINTENMLLEYVEAQQIKKVSVGHGAGTFNLALDYAVQLDPNTIVYFVENDYWHKNNADIILLDGFSINPHFVSLYDHPDKYLDPSLGGNPLCSGGAENTRVYLSKYSHWKMTNSTTMTFAAKTKTLLETEHILRKWTKNTHPYDFQMFRELILDKGYNLITPIPGYATHGETKWLSPLIQWP